MEDSGCLRGFVADSGGGCGCIAQPTAAGTFATRRSSGGVGGTCKIALIL